MKVFILTVLFFGISSGQHGSTGSNRRQAAPDPPSQAEREAIAKEEYRKNVADAATLVKLAAKLKADIENETTQKVSAATAKEAQQIEALAHRMQGRLKH